MNLLQITSSIREPISQVTRLANLIVKPLMDKYPKGKLLERALFRNPRPFLDETSLCALVTASKIA